MKPSQIIEMLRAYGQAMIDLPEYEKRHKEDKSGTRWTYQAYSEQLDLVHNYKKSIETVAREIARGEMCSNKKKI